MHRTVAACSLVLALATAPATAAELAGVTMRDTVEVAGQTLQLNGMALRSKAIFKVYVGGLYLPEKQTDPQEVLGADTARRMILHFVRSVGGDDICEAWRDGLEANTPNASAEVREGFDKLCRWTEDVRAGDRMVFTYVPGQGTTVETKGKRKGVLVGKETADAVFASWIGPHPGPGEKFRDGLMGG